MVIGFCVFIGFISIYEIGVYGISLVKKCRYWPSGIYGYQINAHKNIKIGDHLCYSVNWKGYDFGVSVVNEPNYNMKIIST